jgi:hypothetical protein
MDTNSLGIMTIVVLFCSAPTSVSICMRRSSTAAAFCMSAKLAVRQVEAMVAHRQKLVDELAGRVNSRTSFAKPTMPPEMKEPRETRG